MHELLIVVMREHKRWRVCHRLLPVSEVRLFIEHRLFFEHPLAAIVLAKDEISEQADDRKPDHHDCPDERPLWTSIFKQNDEQDAERRQEDENRE